MGDVSSGLEGVFCPDANGLKERTIRMNGERRGGLCRRPRSKEKDNEWTDIQRRRGEVAGGGEGWRKGARKRNARQEAGANEGAQCSLVWLLHLISLCMGRPKSSSLDSQHARQPCTLRQPAALYTHVYVDCGVALRAAISPGAIARADNRVTEGGAPRDMRRIIDSSGS
jgi:hypothetical protein